MIKGYGIQYIIVGASLCLEIIDLLSLPCLSDGKLFASSLFFVYLESDDFKITCSCVD